MSSQFSWIVSSRCIGFGNLFMQIAKIDLLKEASTKSVASTARTSSLSFAHIYRLYIWKQTHMYIRLCRCNRTYVYIYIYMHSCMCVYIRIYNIAWWPRWICGASVVFTRRKSLSLFGLMRTCRSDRPPARPSPVWPDPMWPGTVRGVPWG